MEPLNDKELKDLLREWKAPAAPVSLTEKFFPGAATTSRWPWLLTGSIRVPVPVGLAVIVIIIASVVFGISNRQRVTWSVGAATLADFQPVHQLQPRILRSSYEAQ
jgi:hypothetical protein